MNNQETKNKEKNTVDISASHQEQAHQEKAQKTDASELNESNKELDVCQKELDNWKEKYIRAQADLDNFQKRVEKERLAWMSNAQAKVFVDLINIIDDFERAFANNNEKSNEEGFSIIYKSLQKMLDKFDVNKMDNYQTFDPVFHEALIQIDSDAHESGQIVEVLQQGYLFKENVLRPAKVSVAK